MYLSCRVFLLSHLIFSHINQNSLDKKSIEKNFFCLVFFLEIPTILKFFFKK